MFNTFLKSISAARVVERSKIESALENISKDLSVTTDSNEQKRILFFKFESSDEIADYYNLSCKLCSNVVITELGIEPKKIASNQLSEYTISCGKIIVANDGTIEVLAANDMLIDKAELTYVSQILNFVRVKLEEQLNIPIQFTGIADIGKEFYKDKEGQYRSTEYGSYIKSIFEDARAELLNLLVSKVHDTIGLERLSEREDTITIRNQIDIIISDYINSNNFNTQFKKSLQEIASLSKIMNTPDILNLDFIDFSTAKALKSDSGVSMLSGLSPEDFLEIFDKIKKIESFETVVDDFCKLYAEQKDFHIVPNSETYKLGINCVNVYFTNIFNNITNTFNELIRNKRAKQINLYKQVFAVDKEELEDIYDTIQRAKTVLNSDKLTNEQRYIFYNQINTYIETVVEAEKDKEELKRSIKEEYKQQESEEKEVSDESELDISISPLESGSDATSEVSVVGDYVNDLNIVNHEDKYYWDEPGTGKREEVSLTDIHSFIERDLGQDIDKDLLDRLIKTDVDSELSEEYADALISDNSYKAFKNRAKEIYNYLIKFYKEINIISNDTDDPNKAKGLIRKALMAYPDLPTDILETLKTAITKGPLDALYAVDYFKAVLTTQINIAKVFVEEFDYKSAANKLKSILNTAKSVDYFYNLKSPMTVDKFTDKKVLPRSNISYKGQYFKEQINDILNSVDDKQFNTAIKNYQELLLKTRDTISNINFGGNSD